MIKLFRAGETSEYRPVFGRSTVEVECRFCGQSYTAYLWSLAGCGKRCTCGALITQRGTFLDCPPVATHRFPALGLEGRKIKRKWWIVWTPGADFYDGLSRYHFIDMPHEVAEYDRSAVKIS